MEAWHRISALGGAGVLGIRRYPLPVLSARFLDSGRRARCGSALEDGAGRVLLDRAHACRSVHVPARPRVAPGRGRSVCGRVLCAESLPLADRLLAERIRRTAGGRAVAASAALSSADLFAGIRAWSSPDAGAESHTGRSLAHERTGGGDDALRDGRAGSRLLCDWSRTRARESTIMGPTVLASPSSGLSPDLSTDGLAMLVGVGLASFYLLPAISERGWIDIGQVLSLGVRPQDNFLFTTLTDPDHNHFNLLVSTVAVVEIGILALAIWFSRRWGVKRAGAANPSTRYGRAPRQAQGRLLRQDRARLSTVESRAAR